MCTKPLKTNKYIYTFRNTLICYKLKCKIYYVNISYHYIYDSTFPQFNSL